MESREELLRRIADLSRLINTDGGQQHARPSKRRKKSSNKVYVRQEPAPAVQAAAHIIPVAPAEAPDRSRRYDAKKRRYVNRTLVSRPERARPTPRPSPMTKRRREIKSHRSAVFVKDESYRRMKANVLQRSRGLGNKSLRVPKPPKQKPVCSFFLRGECFREDCQYQHVNVGKDAGICPDFVRNGLCPRGTECSMKHLKSAAPPPLPKKKEEEAPDDNNDNNSNSSSSSEDEIVLNRSFIKL